MPEFYMIIAKKKFSPIFFVGAPPCPPASPPSPMPMLTMKHDSDRRSNEDRVLHSLGGGGGGCAL